MGCNIPETTFTSMIEKVKNEIKPDVVFWTGDIVPHEIWNQNF